MKYNKIANGSSISLRKMSPISNEQCEKSFVEIIEKWFHTSPSHGIRRIGRSKTLVRRVFWSYILWISTVLMGTFIATIIRKHIGNPTKIHLSVRQYRDPNHFPAVTFCNINPLRDDGFLNDFRKSKLPAGGSSAPMNESEYSKAFAAYIDRIFAAQAIGEIHPLVKWSYQLNDLLITCVFNERVCHQNLTLLFHPNYGNCYTFDHKSHVRREKGPTRHDWSVDNVLGDHNYKLYMELFLHQQEYNQYFDERAAFRFFIHRKHEVPMLSETSLFLGPDRYTKLSFSQRILSFTQRCRTNLTENMKQIFSTQQVRYTQALCMKLCEQRFLEERCQCVLPTLFVFYQFYSNYYDQTSNETRICSIDDECIQNRSSFNSREFCSECLPECEIIQYRVQSSYAVFPNVNSIEKVWHRVRNHFRNDRNVTDYLNKPEGTASAGNRGLKGNILAVEISASPDVTEILTETPVYTWVDLISSIGGQTGLWIGLSMINIVEILELIYLLFVHCFRRLMNK